MKNQRTGFSLAALAAAILLLFQVPSASAQDYDQDPPTRAARISFLEGSVSFQPGGQGDWLEAVRNRPLTVGDNLWVDRDSRAEVQLGSTSIRLGPETSVTFLDLGNRVTQLRLSTGSLFFRVRHYSRDDTFEVDTPNLAFNVTRPGEFRLDVNANGDQTVASIWRGEGEITGAGNSYRLMEGQQGTFSGVDQLSYDVGGLGSEDSFSRWCLGRDEREDRIRSAQYVSTDVTGYEDLDDYGRWHNVGGYGPVWTPVGVPYDWAPYRYGHWAYVYPWGWTWVEEEPWGFAPFHYGRWAFVESTWCWVPGPVVVAPVYAPALVAFIGGGGFSLAVGVGGGIGWFPLGPGEVFVPWYRTSPVYVQNVNVTNTRVNVTQVTNVYNNYTVNHVTNVTYVNQRVTNSVTVVNRDTFVNARPVHQNIERVDSRQLASARVTPAVVTQVEPARQSVVGVARPVQARPPEQAISRPVVATREPVALSRAAPVAAIARPASPPPVRTVRAAPPAEAQPLERGARGGRPTPPAAASRPAPTRTPEPSGAENRGAVPRPGGTAVPRPGAPTSAGPAPAPRPSESAPRPGAPESRPMPPENRPSPAVENGRRPQEVPRPPSASRPEAAPEQPRPSEGRRPETPRTAPEQPPRPSENRDQAPPRYNQGRPEVPPRPPVENRSAPSPEQPRPSEGRRPETPRTAPEQPPRPPDRRDQSPPPDNQPRADISRPQADRPRPQARAAEPPQHETRPVEQRSDSKGEAEKKDKARDNQPPR